MINLFDLTQNVVPFTSRGEYQNPITRREKYRDEDGKQKERWTETRWKTTDIMVKITGPVMTAKIFAEPVPVYSCSGRTNKRNSLPKPIRRQDSLKRSSRLIKDKILANFPLRKEKYVMPVSITLTYELLEGHTIDYRAQALADLARFRRKMRKEYGIHLKFVDALELQERGAIHFHILVFNLRYNDMQKIISFWPHCQPQGVHVRRLKPGKRNAMATSKQYANYITTGNYMSKDFGEYCQVGEKTYFCSQGLEPAQNTTSPDAATDLYNHLRLIENYDWYYMSEVMTHPYYQVPYVVIEYAMPG